LIPYRPLEEEIMERLDRVGIYPAAGALPGGTSWAETLEAEEFGDVLRSAMREEYADASVEEMGDALVNVLDSMSPAEAFNFSSALDRIGKSASRLTSDPTFIQIARTAAPIAGGALGTMVGGPVGTALGSKLGSLAVSALPARAASPSAGAKPVAAAPVPGTAAMPPPGMPPPAAAAPGVVASLPGAAAMPPPGMPPPAAATPVAAPPEPGAARTPRSEIPLALGPASSVAGGSAAAAQCLVLTQHPDVLCCLLATALGHHGRQQVSGLPVAQLLGMLSQVIGQAAADADELMYLGQQADAAESVLENASASSVLSLYTDLLGADNLELAEAAGWYGPGL
jgi:hypothetical protein